MKKLLLICAIATIFLALACPAMADPTVTVQSGPYQVGVSGEFTITVTSTGIPGHSVGSTFQSFCVETNEYIFLGHTYYVVLNDKAVWGGSGGPRPDPLDPRTAWLYNEFLNGTLDGYEFNDVIGRRTSAGALQYAIWFIEQEWVWPPTSGSLADHFVQLANGSDWYTNNQIGNIRVMNLYLHIGPCLNIPAQDQLVRIPAPGALVLGSIGLGCAAWRLRRRRTL